MTTTGAPLNATIPDHLATNWDSPLNATIVAINSQLGAILTALGAKADLVSGRVPNNQMPTLNAIAVQPVTDQAARLALSSATVGTAVLQITDVVNGNGTIYVLTATPPSTNGNWTPVNPGTSVTSVNGETGAVTGYAKLASNNLSFSGTGDAFTNPLTVAAATGNGHAVNLGQMNTAISTATAGLGGSSTPYTTTFGDGSALSFTFSHGRGTANIDYQLWDVSVTPQAEVRDADAVTTTSTQITLTYLDAPALNARKLVVK